MDGSSQLTSSRPLTDIRSSIILFYVQVPVSKFNNRIGLGHESYLRFGWIKRVTHRCNPSYWPVLTALEIVRTLQPEFTRFIHYENPLMSIRAFDDVTLPSPQINDFSSITNKLQVGF